MKWNCMKKLSQIEKELNKKRSKIGKELNKERNKTKLQQRKKCKTEANQSKQHSYTIDKNELTKMQIRKIKIKVIVRSLIKENIIFK